MIHMMIDFAKDFFTYRKEVKKQDGWIKKYAERNGYELNPNPMIYTHLKIWLVQMTKIYGKRMCPCFDPSADETLNKKMACPCAFIEEEIKEYGTCHCALFGKKGMTKKEWKTSSARLMGEYRVSLNLQGDVLDTRGMPMDPLRNLPVPDASHQLKTTLMTYKGEMLTVLVATEQEVKNLEKISAFRGWTMESKEEGDHYKVVLTFK